MAEKIYNSVGTWQIAAHDQPMQTYIKYHQYLNTLANYRIDDKIRNSLEYRHLNRNDKQWETWVKYFSNELICLAPGVGIRVEDTKKLFSWHTIKSQQTEENMLLTDKFFATVDTKIKNHKEPELWQESTLLVFQKIWEPKLQTPKKHYYSTVPYPQSRNN